MHSEGLADGRVDFGAQVTCRCMEIESGSDCADRVVLMSRIDSEQSQDFIADKLIHNAAMRFNDFDRHMFESEHDGFNVFRIQMLM